MRPPNESLEEFNRIRGTRKPAEPPSMKSVQPLGTVTVLEPLARYEGLAKSAVAGTSVLRGLFGGLHRLSWFHRSLIASAAVAIIAFIGSSILVAIYGPTVEPVASPSDMATNLQPENFLTPPQELEPAELSPAENSPFVFREVHAVRSAPRSRHARPRTLIATYHPRHLVPLPQFTVSDFIPTTLVIYVENGEIKTRIEPWLTASYKKPATFQN